MTGFTPALDSRSRVCFNCGMRTDENREAKAGREWFAADVQRGGHPVWDFNEARALVETNFNGDFGFEGDEAGWLVVVDADLAAGINRSLERRGRYVAMDGGVTIVIEGS